MAYTPTGKIAIFFFIASLLEKEAPHSIKTNSRTFIRISLKKKKTSWWMHFHRNKTWRIIEQIMYICRLSPFYWSYEQEALFFALSLSILILKIWYLGCMPFLMSSAILQYWASFSEQNPSLLKVNSSLFSFSLNLFPLCFTRWPGSGDILCV